MKKSFILPLFIFITTAALSQLPNTDIKADSTGVSKTIQYTCSMHPEIVTNKPGNCPKCGMQLVEKSKLSDSKNMKMMHPMMMGGMNDSNHKRKFPIIIIMGTMMAVMAIVMILSRSR